MTARPFLKLNNGEILNVGDVKKTISGELTIQKFSYGFDLASRTSIINHLIHKHKLNFPIIPILFQILTPILKIEIDFATGLINQ